MPYLGTINFRYFLYFWEKFGELYETYPFISHISAFCNGTNLAAYSDNLSYDVTETDIFPSPAMLAALYSTLQVPYDFDETSVNGEVTLHINVKATCGGACEMVETSDTVASSLDATVLLYSTLDLSL